MFHINCCSIVSFLSLGKLVLMDEKVRSVRPYSIDSDMDSEVEQNISKHMRPLLNVLYAKGKYHVYQADSLVNEPGLTTELSKKTKADRYFVTNQIKSIAGKASVVVADGVVQELADALEEPENKHLKALKPYLPSESEDEDDFLDPLYHEAQAKVSISEALR